MLENGATRQQLADVTGVGVKTIYKYLPVQYGDKNPMSRHTQGKYYITSLLCASSHTSIFQEDAQSFQIFLV